MNLSFIKKNFPKCYVKITTYDYSNPELRELDISELNVLRIIFKKYKKEFEKVINNKKIKDQLVKSENQLMFEFLKEIEEKLGEDK
jgi:hypothetical protein